MTRGLVLSLFPGAGLLDKGFEREGFAVLRGPDTVFGQDVRSLHLVNHSGVFEGVIGGPPCQDFSRARRRPPSGHGLAMLREYVRIVTEAQPIWWLMENVPGVPDVRITGYVTQRFNLFASEFGLAQERNRSFQFGSRDGVKLCLLRRTQSQKILPAVMATYGKDHRTFADVCELQGLPRNFDLPGLSRSAKFRAVGNGVPVPMAAAVAQAIRERARAVTVRLCACDCGRPVTGKQLAATAACRKRLERSLTFLGRDLPPPSIQPRLVKAAYKSTGSVFFPLSLQRSQKGPLALFGARAARGNEAGIPKARGAFTQTCGMGFPPHKVKAASPRSQRVGWGGRGGRNTLRV
jgi:DNA (cytosine-5)-methyltransferase 1